MDLTQLFKACVKTIRLRNKSVAAPDKSRLLKTRPRDEFLIRANDVRYQLTQLRDLLIENRSAYMRLGSHLKVSAHMSDEERNIIDMESEKIVSICNQYLKNLQSECLKTKKNDDDEFFNHKMAILNLLYDYLENVFGIHCKYMGNRTQHELETYKLLKLESKQNGVRRDENEDHSDNDLNDLVFDKNAKNRKNSSNNNDERTSSDCKKRTSTGTVHTKAVLEDDQTSKLSLDEEHLTSDDIQVFESENVQLLNVLKGLSDEVDQIEKNVVGISRLQTIFTEKVKFCLNAFYAFRTSVIFCQIIVHFTMD